MRLILLNPAGLAALLALAGPILVHLLLRRRARRLLFPSLRFVRASNAAAVRLRAITDWPLLAARCAIVAAAALALARPLLVTPARREGWNARTARAVVVDVTPTVGPASSAVEEERRGVFTSTVIRSQVIEEGVAEAVRWLAAAPPARREVVVVSDFQVGAIDRQTIDRIPDSFGVRLRPIPSGTTPAAEPGVRVIVETVDRDRGAADAALRAAGQGTEVPVSAAGRRTVAIYTRGARVPESLGALLAPWMATVATAVANARTGAVDDRIVAVVLDAPASSFELPRAIRSVRRALLAPAAWRELEPGRLAAPTLAAWSRPASPLAGDVEHADEKDDGRWFWLAALAFIGLETWLRRRSATETRSPAEATRAA
jgi:hypothetical protein